MPDPWGVPIDLLRGEEQAPSHRAITDAMLTEEISRIFEDNYRVYGVRKIWHQLRREGVAIGKDRVRRLMREAGLQGARRGKPRFTTKPAPGAPRPPDLVDRNFSADAPNELWVADFTYVRTWAGFCYVAFVEDVFSRMIVGWSLATHMRTSLVTEALEMAVWRRDASVDGLVHHSYALLIKAVLRRLLEPSQYVSVLYSEQMAAHGIVPSVGLVGDSFDDAMAESPIGLYKAELIWRRGPWRTVDQLELATLEYIDWFFHRRLHGAIDHVPPTEFEEVSYASRTEEGIKG